MANEREFFKFLKAYYNRPLVGVEIGVYRGENSFDMLANLKIEKLYLIDPYEDYYGGCWESRKKQSEYDDIYNTITKKLIPYKDKVEVIRKKSCDAIDKIPEVDFVYIDGNHEFDYVLQDIALYYPKIKEGGVLSGDNLEYKDVANVVTQFFYYNKMKLWASTRRISFEWWGIKNANGI